MGFRNVHRESRFLFLFCFCKLLSVTRFLKACHCYLHISDAFSQHASLVFHISDVFSQHASLVVYISDVFSQHASLVFHISDVFLCIINLSTSQTQQKVTRLFCVTNDPLDESLIRFSGIVDLFSTVEMELTREGKAVRREWWFQRCQTTCMLRSQESSCMHPYVDQ
jgi:hypothetical protein